MKVLFDLRRPYFLTGHISVIRRLRELGLQVGVCSMEPHLEERFRQFIALEGYDIEPLPSEAAAASQWDLVMVAGGLYDRRYQPGQRVGRIHHGGCLGNSRTMYSLTSFREHDMDVFFAISQRDIDLGAKFYPGIWDGKLTKVVGWPKLDRLLANRVNRAEEVQRLGLDPQKKTVLFLSHWTENSLIRTIGLNVIAALGLLVDYNVIITAHPLMFTDVRDSLVHSPELVLQSLCSMPHMRFLPEPDSTKLLPLADVCICDYSSVTYELAALDTPTLWYCDPKHNFSDPILYNKTIKATYRFTGVQEVKNLLAWVAGHPKEKRVARRELAEFVYAHLGSATETCARAIIEATAELAALSMHTVRPHG